MGIWNAQQAAPGKYTVTFEFSPGPFPVKQAQPIVVTVRGNGK